MGVDEQGPIWAQRPQIWTLIFFIFEKQFWLSAGTADMKNDLFLYPKNSIVVFNPYFCVVDTLIETCTGAGRTGC
jgi:hypothetical protein